MVMGWHFLKCDVIGLFCVILKIFIPGGRDLHALSQGVGRESVYGK